MVEGIVVRRSLILWLAVYWLLKQCSDGLRISVGAFALSGWTFLLAALLMAE